MYLLVNAATVMRRRECSEVVPFTVDSRVTLVVDHMGQGGRLTPVPRGAAPPVADLKLLNSSEATRPNRAPPR
jgi:hypothetical protein